MVSRRELNSEHENAVLSAFQDCLSRKGKKLKLVSRPNPPDAIVNIDGVQEWIEITDAFLDKAHAIGITTNAADDKKHISDAKRCIDPDVFLESFYKTIEKNI